MLLFAFLIVFEAFHQVLDLLYFCIRISVYNLCEILHETEVCTHGVSESSQLTKFRDESDFVSCSSVFIYQQRLIWLIDALIVSSLVVLTVACLSALFVETCLRTLSKVNTVDLVRLLIVFSDNSRTGESLLNSIIGVLVATLSVLSDFLHVLEDSVCTDHFEANVNVEQTALFLHDQPRVEARPHLNVMSIEAVSISLIKGLLSDCFKSKTAHHRIEEDLEEIHVVTILLLHDLHPLNCDRVFDSIMLR